VPYVGGRELLKIGSHRCVILFWLPVNPAKRVHRSSTKTYFTCRTGHHAGAWYPCSFGLSDTSRQYFSLRTNQPPAMSQQYFSLRTNQHQPSATPTRVLHCLFISFYVFPRASTLWTSPRCHIWNKITCRSGQGSLWRCSQPTTWCSTAPHDILYFFKKNMM
jgi:hypothetical protein